jgi:DNA-directed RNA polymerase specialized sigma24 family protein
MGNRARTRFGGPSPEEADLAEIEAVYRRSVARLRRVAAAIVGEREAALDAVQTGFSTAVRRRMSFRGDGTLDAWVWRIVVNEARDLRARLLSGDGAAGEGVGGRLAHEGGARDEILNALAELSERQRLVVFLRYYADLDYSAIARVLAKGASLPGVTSLKIALLRFGDSAAAEIHVVTNDGDTFSSTFGALSKLVNEQLGGALIGSELEVYDRAGGLVLYRSGSSLLETGAALGSRPWAMSLSAVGPLMGSTPSAR